MKRNHSISTPTVGGSSLLVIFAVLCLTVFALLSLSTVQAEKRMADASAHAVSAYYEADLQAQTVFARLRAGETVSGVQVDGNVYRYSCPVTENQILKVELKEHNGWEVILWQVIARSEPISETLPVWNGE